ncbi:hypothetical protein ACSAZL_22205 [Methanosarcina sp. T3]|uniref:hypothetical protein n=1 Tax=Methanosarcina sp. T3 TaxID=3439062 RepID=UPI003F8677B2
MIFGSCRFGSFAVFCWILVGAILEVLLFWKFCCFGGFAVLLDLGGCCFGSFAVFCWILVVAVLEGLLFLLFHMEIFAARIIFL